MVSLYHIQASLNFVLKVNDTGCAIRARSSPTSGVIKFISKGTMIEATKRIISDNGIESFKISSGGWISNMNNIMVVQEPETVMENKEVISSSSINQFNDTTILPITTMTNTTYHLNLNASNADNYVDSATKSKTITIPNTVVSTAIGNNNDQYIETESDENASTFQAITTLFFSFDTSSFGFSGEFTPLSENNDGNNNNDKPSSSSSSSIAATLKEELSDLFPDNVIRSPSDKIFAKSNIVIDVDCNSNMVTTTSNNFYMDNLNHIRKIVNNDDNENKNENKNKHESHAFTWLHAYITKMVSNITSIYQSITSTVNVKTRAFSEWPMFQPIRDLASFDVHNDLWH